MKLTKRKERKIKNLLSTLKELNDIMPLQKSYEKFCEVADAIENIEEEFRNLYQPPTISLDSFYLLPDKTQFDFLYQKRNVLDLFAGIGNFSYKVEFANTRQTIHLIDIDQEALEIAKQVNKSKSYINYKYHNIDLFKVDENFLKRFIEDNDIGLILVNPPFSQDFKDKTLEFMYKLFKATPEYTPIIAILPDSFIEDLTFPENTGYYIEQVGIANFTNTKIQTKVFEIINQPLETIEPMQFETKEPMQLVLF